MRGWEVEGEALWSVQPGEQGLRRDLIVIKTSSGMRRGRHWPLH